MPDNTMTFPGVADARQRADLIAYLKAVAEGQAPSTPSAGMMTARPKSDLKQVAKERRVTAIRYCGDGYHVTTEAGRTIPFWEFNLRFKTDSSRLGPERSIGHATFLLDFDGFVVLTDPWFHEVPLSGTHPEPLGLSPARLPSPDLILATHGHRDHLDKRFLRDLPDKRVPVMVPPSIAPAVRVLGFSTVHGPDAWQATRIGPVTVTAVPVEHYGETYAYVIERADKIVLFVAETTFFPDLRRAAERFPRIDVAFLPADGLTLR